MNQLSLAESIDGLGQGIVITVPFAFPADHTHGALYDLMGETWLASLWLHSLKQWSRYKTWGDSGFEIACNNGDVVTAVFMKDCCDREIVAWPAWIGRGLPGEVVRDMIIEAVEAHFGNIDEPAITLEFLSDNCGAFRAIETRTAEGCRAWRGLSEVHNTVRWGQASLRNPSGLIERDVHATLMRSGTNENIPRRFDPISAVTTNVAQARLHDMHRLCSCHSGQCARPSQPRQVLHKIVRNLGDSKK